MDNPSSQYVLLTAARNEEAHIGATIEAVVSQMTPPVRWVIVSDGSTDRTDEIVSKAAEAHKFIDFVKLESGPLRGFASKVNALEIGRARLADIDYAFIGTLDADITFAPNYYERMLAEFEAEPKVGIVGGNVHEPDKNGIFQPLRGNPESLGGAIQFFRRECFEKVVPFHPLRLGGEDAIAEFSARMFGWRIKALSDVPVQHHRVTGTAGKSVYRTRFEGGIAEYYMEYAYLYHLARSVYLMKFEPRVVGGMLSIIGYLWAAITREPRIVPAEIVRFNRRDQMRRLRERILPGRTKGLGRNTPTGSTSKE